MGQPIFVKQQVRCTECKNPADTDFSGTCSMECYLKGIKLLHTHDLRHSELNRLLQLADSLKEIPQKRIPASIKDLSFPFRYQDRLYLDHATSYWVSNLAEEYKEREELVKSSGVELPDEAWEIIFQLKNRSYGKTWKFCKDKSLRVEKFKGEDDYDDLLGIEYKDKAEIVLGSANFIEITGTGKSPGRKMLEDLCELILWIDIERPLREDEKDWVEIRPIQRPCIVAIKRMWDDQRAYSIDWEFCVFP